MVAKSDRVGSTESPATSLALTREIGLSEPHRYEAQLRRWLARLACFRGVGGRGTDTPAMANSCLRVRLGYEPADHRDGERGLSTLGARHGSIKVFDPDLVTRADTLVSDVRHVEGSGPALSQHQV
ncbi:MAG: hypothetical protein JO198_12820 [Candidatus Dormibacteraeota bacterium]|nr:hypothetical protein [Candidatus Dormibacteraeota bacterium]